MNPALTLSTQIGPPGTNVVVVGSDFPPNAAVDLYFITIELTLAAADRLGAFKVSVQIPAYALPGIHWIVAAARVAVAGVQASFFVTSGWPQSRSSPSQAGVNIHENVLTIANVGNLGLRWSASGSIGESSPAIFQGKIYVVGPATILALDATTGAEQWTTAFFSTKTSPAAAGGVLYAGSSDGSVYALNALTGVKSWQFICGSGCSATVANGVVYACSNTGVYALNASTGDKLWQFTTRGLLGDIGFQYSPAVADGVVYVASTGSDIYALIASTGGKLWEFPVGAIGSSPAVGNGVVYVGTNDNNIFALNASTGDKLWQFSAVGAIRSSPAVTNGVVYVGSNDKNVYALNSATGVKLWQFPTGAEVYSSPAVANGVVFIGSWDKNVYALNASSGALLWHYATGGRVSSSPAVADGVVCVASEDGKVYAFSLNGQ